MKILTLNHADSYGGAARAAYRIHSSLRQQGVDSRMLVNQLDLDDCSVSGPDTTLQKIAARIAPHLALQICKLQKLPSSTYCSLACIPSHWRGVINNSDADLVNLHWVSKEMLSIEDIGNISKPVVWTLHDMWPFCGAEHFADGDRWQDGYFKSNRPSGESGVDLNRWVWQRKVKSWRSPIHIVAVSSWLADKVRQSSLMGNWPVSVIPNTIDTDVWQPVDKHLARALMGVPDDRPVVAFGAWGCDQPQKGFDLLKSALAKLNGRRLGIRLLTFGQLAADQLNDIDYPIHRAGHLHDDISLRILYSAADVMVVPSRMESFGQTASEAQACGTPVVAFNCTGITDVVEHGVSGYLATPFEVEDLAHGISTTLNSADRLEELSRNARRLVIERFSYPKVAGSYKKLYEEITAGFDNNSGRGTT